MARSGFYNDNLNRDFPFLWLETEGLPDCAIADFGCVMGATSGFVEGVHTVFLSAIKVAGDNIVFEFSSDAPGLAGKVLRFARTVSDPLYATDYQTAVDSSVPTLVDCILACTSVNDCDTEQEEACHGDSDWTGFLVTGKLAKMLELLEGCDIGSCDAYEEAEPPYVACDLEFDIRVEPSLIQNLAGGYVRSVSAANAERTRAAAPTECKDYCWPFPLADHYVSCECLTGPIRFKPGYNACIEQNEAENSITISACQGGGAGEPCTDVQLTEGEGPPEGRTTLDGALKCDEAVKSINGVSQRFFEILGGPGVIVTSVPEESKVIIDVNLQTLSLCADLREQSSINPEESSSVGPCDCGEE